MKKILFFFFICLKIQAGEIVFSEILDQKVFEYKILIDQTNLFCKFNHYGSGLISLDIPYLDSLKSGPCRLDDSNSILDDILKDGEKEWNLSIIQIIKRDLIIGTDDQNKPACLDVTSIIFETKVLNYNFISERILVPQIKNIKYCKK